ncbi:hypothetical protein LCGC14_1945580 [marine sediment metagenome]|uniref:Anti-CBASS protein Acb1 n=1 Tax=marine sediment metagenome TaxID=412755 RepID=A0A0F9HXB2_9ZZZZ
MKLKDIRKTNEYTFEAEKKKGSYAGVHFDDDTIKRIKAFTKENKIPQRVQSRKLHSTVVFSKKYLPNYKAQGGLKTPIVGKPKKFSVWDTQPNKEGKTTNSLVLQYDSPELIARHNELKKEHGATHDFDEFKPHVTLSYDIGDLDISKLDPKSIGDINIVSEFGGDLDLDFLVKNNAS